MSVRSLMKYVAAAFLVSLLFEAPVTAQGAPEFQHLHGGPIRGVFFLDGDLGWTGEDGGRIRYTTDGGATWEYADVPETVESQVELIDIHVIDLGVGSGLVGWAVGREGVVLKSTDFEAQEWADLNPSSRLTNNVGAGAPCTLVGQPAVLRDIFMIDQFSGWIVGEDGAMYTTSDGGETWTPHANPPSQFNCDADPYDIYRVHFFEDSGAGFADYSKGVMAAEFGFVFNTTDGGVNWTGTNVFYDVPGGEACPELLTGENLEFWGLSFEDPSDVSSVGWLAGGAGTDNGFILALLQFRGVA